MARKRRWFTAEFKARVALKALRERGPSLRTGNRLDPKDLDRFRIQRVSRYSEESIPAYGVKLKPLWQREIAKPHPGRVEDRPGLREDRGAGEARVKEAEGLLRKDACPDGPPVIQQKPVEKRLV